ncbi:MAG: FAD-binding oxidoreductase [Planctomycetaceae bacterium]|nr:FAD-binding oxidoreductase [Planctomycetaceae bacterium]
MKDIRFAKFVVWLNCAVPAVLLIYDAFAGRLGANPVNFAIRTTGLLSLVFLVLSLAVTPLARSTRWHWLSHFRRAFGLYAFFHAAAHFAIYFGLDRALSLSSTFSEMLIRPYLTVGATGLILMIPLAVTSTNSMIQRLGPKRWKLLHRLAYVAAAAGVVHYYMLVKADVTQPVAFGIVVGALLGYRAVAAFGKPRSVPSKAVADGKPAKPKFWSGQLQVVRITRETPDVCTFRLASPTGGELPFDYLPGQYLNLALQIDGRKVNRSYTIASTPSRTGYCELSIKREPNGVASKFMHDQVREGDLLNISAPAGRFTFTGAEAPSIVMLAGGVGVTPLMSQLRYLTDQCWTGEIYFLFSVRTEADIIFREELAVLQQQHPNLRVIISLTRADGSSWTGERGRFTPEMLNRVVPQLTLRRVHYCGPEEMNQALGPMLRELGVPESQIKSESFSSPVRNDAGAAPAADAAAEDATGASITFTRSGKSAAVVNGQSILDIAEDLGVNLDYDCRSGICGTCKIKVLSGRVRMETEDALTAADRAAGVILSCQARCLDAVTVDA